MEQLASFESQNEVQVKLKFEEGADDDNGSEVLKAYRQNIEANCEKAKDRFHQPGSSSIDETDHLSSETIGWIMNFISY